jgi:hypothetical protein
MVMVLILVAVLTIVPFVIAHDVDTEYPLLTSELHFQQAQVAAEAGVQHYRNLLDNIPNYWQYSSTNLPPSNETDTALAANGWNSVASNSDESYHYIPNTNCILTTDCAGSSDSGDMVLTVTGRAGTTGYYSYYSVVATFNLSGLLNDSYYSDYELLDPLVPNEYPTATYTDCTAWGSGKCTASTTVTVSETQILVPAADDYSTMNIPVASMDDSLFMELCGYESYQENGYISNGATDGAGSISDPNGPTYNGTTPYYGPFYGATPITAGSFTLPAGTSYNPTDSLPAIGGSNQDQALKFTDPCTEPFNFKGGENFSATVYTNDQLYTDTESDGDPTFLGVPPLDSGARNNPNLTYAWNWPGSASKVVNGVTEYYPKGWIDTAGGDPTDLTYASVTGGLQTLPQFDSSLKAYADGEDGNGCLFTGPTMIEFVKPAAAGGPSTMNVWSPLTQSNSAYVNSTTYTSTANCGTYSPSSPWQTGVALPPDGVIYVQSVPSNTQDANYASSAAPSGSLSSSCPTTTSGWTAANPFLLPCADYDVIQGTPPVANECLDPYTPLWSSTWLATPAASQCPAGNIGEGDAIIEGELSGQITLASDANVLISRDVTYACADGTGGASETIPAACSSTTQSSDNILGVAANDDIVVSHPTDQSGNGSPGWVSSAPISCGTQDGTTLTAAISSGASAATLNSYVAPTCDMQNPIADMAAVALGGSVGVESYDQTDAFYSNGSTSGGGFYLNGTDISFFRGPFGTFNNTATVTGYEKELSYDTRLGYITPPFFLGAISSIWDLTSTVVCGTQNAYATGSCTQVK